MTAFTDLGAEFEKWRTRYFEYQRSVASFAERFTRAYREYIGAPESYHEDFEETRRVPYVRLMKAVEREDGSGWYDGRPTGNVYDFLAKNSEGLWCAFITTRLEINSQTWPKQEFGILVKFDLDGNDCEMTISQGESHTFRLVADDPSTWPPAFNFIVYLLKTSMQTPPNAQQRFRKTFGFTSGMPTPPKSS